MTLLKLENISKIYNSGSENYTALNNININVSNGDFLAISGKSGSGKSTLLNIIGLIDSPTSGDLYLDNIKINHLADNELSHYRSNYIGFIFQNFNLFPLLTAIENIEYQLRMIGINKDEANAIAKNSLDLVDLKSHYNKFPSQLSGGQRQRVAIARAIAKKPKLLLADEPTANLDSMSSDLVFEIFKNLHKELNLSVIFCSHDTELLNLIPHKITLKDGKMI